MARGRPFIYSQLTPYQLHRRMIVHDNSPIQQIFCLQNFNTNMWEINLPSCLRPSLTCFPFSLTTWSQSRQESLEAQCEAIYLKNDIFKLGTTVSSCTSKQTRSHFTSSAQGSFLTAVVILSVDRLNQLFLGLDFRGLL